MPNTPEADAVKERQTKPLTHRFKFEVSTPNGGNLWFRTLGQPYRGKLSRTEMHANGRTADFGEKMAKMPDIPGIVFEVDCRRRRVDIIDPLIVNEKEKDPNLKREVKKKVEQISRVLDGAGLPPTNDDASNGYVEFADEDALVTFLAEVNRMAASKAIVILDGKLPTADELTVAPGFELNDPGSLSQTKAYYKKDHAAHIRGIESVARV